MIEEFQNQLMLYKRWSWTWYWYFDMKYIWEYEVVRGWSEVGTFESTNGDVASPPPLPPQYLVHTHSTNNSTDSKCAKQTSSGEGGRGEFCMDWVIITACNRGADIAWSVWPRVSACEYVHLIKGAVSPSKVNSCNRGMLIKAHWLKFSLESSESSSCSLNPVSVRAKNLVCDICRQPTH